jgi:prophage antirepressor-like protein
MLEFFDFRGTRFTRLTGQDGKPWWVAKDLSDYLELTTPSQVVKSLPDIRGFNSHPSPHTFQSNERP